MGIKTPHKAVSQLSAPLPESFEKYCVTGRSSGLLYPAPSHPDWSGQWQSMPDILKSLQQRGLLLILTGFPIMAAHNNVNWATFNAAKKIILISWRKE